MWMQWHTGEASIYDILAIEAEARASLDVDVDVLARRVAALVSPDMVARQAEPYAQGYINAINYVLALLAEQKP